MLRVRRQFWARALATSTNTIKADICIVGGGIVGKALACAIAASPYAENTSIIIIESGDMFAKAAIESDIYSNRVSSVTPSSRRFLDSLNVWERIERKKAYGEMVVYNGTDGLLEFECQPEEQGIAHIVENRLIQAALGGRIHEDGKVKVLNGQKVESMVLERNKPVMVLESGTRVECGLLVGADGFNSKVREFAKIDTVGYKYGQTGLVGTVELEGIVNNTAWQRFLPSGPIALLPLSDTHSSLVWSLRGDLSARLAKLSDENFVILLNAALNNPVVDVEYLMASVSTDGTTFVDLADEAKWGLEREQAATTPPVVLSVSVGSRASFPLRLMHAKQYTSDRVALVGDAAHTLHPLAGQGLNLGLADAQSLARLVCEGLRDGQDIGITNLTLADPHLLSNYSTSRFVHNSGMLISCDILSRLYSSESPLIAKAVSFGMSSLNRLTFAKTLFGRFAS